VQRTYISGSRTGQVGEESGGGQGRQLGGRGGRVQVAQRLKGSAAHHQRLGPSQARAIRG
jgi:hypothetical protein